MKKPKPKVAAAGIGGAVATVVVWIVSLFGVAVPAEVAAAFASLIALAAGYAQPE